MVTELDQKTALVLIDLQRGLMKTALLTPAEDILHNAAKLVAAFRKANLPVVIVHVNPAGFKPTRTEAPQRSGQPFTAGDLEIMPEIRTAPDDVFITKHTWGAFHETALDAELRKRGVTGIVLAGIATSAGVESTARSASEHGYNIAFARDAMTDRNAEAHQNSLKNIFPRLGEVDDTDKIVEKLAGIPKPKE